MTVAARLVQSDAEFLGSMPVFVGPRVPERAFTDSLEGGQPLDDFLEALASVTRNEAVGSLEIARDASLRAAA